MLGENYQKTFKKKKKTPFSLKVRGKHNFCISHASYMDCYLSEQIAQNFKIKKPFIILIALITHKNVDIE